MLDVKVFALPRLALSQADAEHRESQGRNPHVLLRELLSCFSALRLGRSRRPVSISSRIARVMQPEANRTAPSSRIRRSTALPAESMNVTASSSTRTDEASRRAVTLDQQRASSSTQGPASRPSSVTVAPPGRVVTEIRSIDRSHGKTHAVRAGRSRARNYGGQGLATRVPMPTSRTRGLSPAGRPMVHERPGSSWTIPTKSTPGVQDLERPSRAARLPPTRDVARNHAGAGSASDCIRPDAVPR
jgi:hypothetical protein